MGPKVPIPAIQPLMETFESAEVTCRDDGRSGFQINFKAIRDPLLGPLDYSFHLNPQTRVFNRVILITTIMAIPYVLMDGIITNRQLSPGANGGSDMVTITGEDVSVMMDLEEKTMEHPGQTENVIAAKIIAMYSQYGLIPTVIPPPVADVPVPTERTPVQRGTDLAYLRDMAARYGYVFYIESGPVPGSNIAYWGPPKRLGLPQSAITYNMGAASNVETISFEHDALAPELVDGRLQDGRTNIKLPVMTLAAMQTPLAREQSLAMNMLNARKILPDNAGGLNIQAAMARAQGATNKSVGDTVTARGTIDAIKYGKPLKARSIVGVRGVGETYDGMYYVKEVTHGIQKGSYKQNFTLTREGTGALSPVVRV
ncbi:hypothetical protein [Desulfonema magnum]|nr:hypothetical protein [Desulfonema magnum]